MAGTSQPSFPKKRRMAPFPWENYLKVKNMEDQLKNFDGEYDIPEKKTIEKGISELVGKLNISEQEKASASATMKLIVTYYSKKIRQPYDKKNGWLKLLLPLIRMDHSPSAIFNLFEAIRERHVPYDENCEHTLRLLFLYHDPELAQFIVRKRVSFHKFSAEWTASLFAGICKHDIVETIWKELFRKEEPMIFYLVLVIVITHRAKILSMKNDNKDVIIQTIAALPKFIESGSVSVFLSTAEYYKKETPFSFEYEFFLATFGNPEKHTPLTFASAYLCLPVLVDELTITANKVFSRENSKSMEFIIIDLRPADEFDAGHFPNAINLDYTLHFQDPSVFADRIDELLSRQPTDEAELAYNFDLHFCFMGSGREEDDIFLTTFMDPMLELRLKFISMLKNGYQAVHDFFKEDLDNKLESHNSEQCLICNPNASMRKSSSKAKKETLWKKLKKVSCLEQGDPNSPVSSKKIAGCSSNAQDFRIVSIEEYSKNPQKLHLIICTQLRSNDQQHECRLFITESSIDVLRLIKGREDLAYVISKRSLSEVLRISKPSDHPELLKINYGIQKGKNVIVDEKQRFIIPNKEDAKLISNAVIKDMKKNQLLK